MRSYGVLKDTMDDIQVIRDTVRKLSESEIPRYLGAEFYNSVPRDLFETFSSVGLTGLAVPQEFGGLGLNILFSVATLEEIAAVDLGPAIFLSVHNMVAGIIARYSSSEQQTRLLPALASGKYLAAFALSEPSAGSNAAALKTRATRAGDEWVINGEKCYITSAGFADLYLLFARTGDAEGEMGAFIITRDLFEQAGAAFKISPPEQKMGCELSPIASITISNLRIPQSALLGASTEGYNIARSGLAGGRITIAACALGVSQHALAKTLAHLKEREQFGSKLIDFQGLQFMLAEMQMKYEAARALTYEAARLLANSPESRENKLFPSYAKCFATDAAMSITTDAVQLLGGAGYIKDYGVEKLMRDAKMLQIVEGTNQIQRIIIAKELARR